MVLETIKKQEINLEYFNGNITKMERNDKINLDHLEIKLVEQINNQDLNFNQIENKLSKTLQEVKESKDYNSKGHFIIEW